MLVPRRRRRIRTKPSPPRAVCIVGPMSAGNRILRDVIELSGLLTRVDTTHGTADIDVVDTLVLVVTRDPLAMRASYQLRWEGHEAAVPIDDSLRGIAERYPDAERVSYERLCARPDTVIRRVAALLEIPPWPCPLTLTNQNAKWSTPTCAASSHP
jgi:hypothetical protein